MVINQTNVLQSLVIHTPCKIKFMLVDGFNTPTSQKKVLIPVAAVLTFTALDMCKDVLPMMVRVRAEEVHINR